MLCGSNHALAYYVVVISTKCTMFVRGFVKWENFFFFFECDLYQTIISKIYINWFLKSILVISAQLRSATRSALLGLLLDAPLVPSLLWRPALVGPTSHALPHLMEVSWTDFSFVQHVMLVPYTGLVPVLFIFDNVEFQRYLEKF